LTLPVCDDTKLREQIAHWMNRTPRHSFLVGFLQWLFCASSFAQSDPASEPAVAAINPGNSGGPLIDLAGALVGISSVKMAFTSQGIPTQGLGFAIPADTIRTKVDQLKKNGSTTKNRQRSSQPKTGRPPNLL
jgi:S1-C subfamily serine protease